MIYSETPIDVRYAETDKMGVVYHANYAIWLEVARTDYIYKAGFSYADMEEAGIISPVVDLNIKYKKSITYPERVIIKTWISHYSPIRSIYSYEILNEDGEIVSTGSTTHVCLKKGTNRPIRLDKSFPEWHESYLKIKEETEQGIDRKL